MSDDRRERDPGQELRRRAESRAAAAPPGELEALGPEAVERLVHELRVHQIELELQNEELRLAQQALEASRARYFELFDLAPVGYFVLGQEGLVQEANLTAAALFGVNRGDLKGRPLSRWIRSVDQDLYYQHRRLLLETERPQTCELRIARSDGLELWIRLESTLERCQLGRIVCRTTASNVTEERTLRARLAESDRLASLGLIAAGVSHEIANPLTSVLYNLECIAEERLDAEEVGELARAALASATQIRTITRVLGAFSRVDPAERRPVDLREVIEHAIAMAVPQLQGRARLEREHGPVPEVLASSGRLAQVFFNLLLNAAQAIREGSDPEENVIRVRTLVEGDQVLVEVSDTGVGIAEAHRALVFEPFFTTRELGKGSGLGLSVARRLVAEFDGQISFETVVGSGTRFVVRLPAAAAAEAAGPRAMPSEVSTRRDRILVVDDDTAVRRMLERSLGGTLEVVLAPGGEEARAILAGDQRFDLILLDVMMPGVTGIDLHRWLAEAHPTLAARVVFISGGSFSEEYLGRVGNPLLPKPLDGRVLVRTVGELVLKARAAEIL